MKTRDEKSEFHYYTDDIDTVFADTNVQMHIYNIIVQDFVPTDIQLDIMKWHEFPASELKEMINETSKNLIANDERIWNYKA